MNKEQAIEIIETHSDDISSSSLLGQALNMAIDALKAQLSNEGTTKDAISRQAAIDALNEYFARIGKLKRRGLTEGEKAISLDTVGTIKTLPPAQPEPKEGHWIGCDGSYICSECNGSPIDFIGTMGISFDAYVETPMNYCPNCGARMKGATT